MNIGEIKPKVSIGLPVYNGEKTIKKSINSLLSQTFRDFELIISDNASDDETSNICKGFSLKDPRIKYIRQKKNIGVGENFKYVLEKASGKYFMWIGADDWISSELLEVNVSVLELNLNFVSSTSPNCFEGNEHNPNKHVIFNLRGSPKERFAKFLQNAWNSHGIFYSLIRTEILKNCKDINFFSYIAADWSLDFFLASKGEVNRTKDGLFVLGKFGGSRNKNPWKDTRIKSIEFFIPLYDFSKTALGLMKNLEYRDWFYVFVQLLKINFVAMKSSYKSTIKEFIK